MEDTLWWKKTFDGKWSLMEDDLWWKTTFYGGSPLMEDNLWWKTTFDRRWTLMDDNLWWKTTFDDRWPLEEGNLKRKIVFDGRGPLMEDDNGWKTMFHRGHFKIALCHTSMRWFLWCMGKFCLRYKQKFVDSCLIYDVHSPNVSVKWYSGTVLAQSWEKMQTHGYCQRKFLKI